jgi:hypothetical protein
MFLLQAPNEIRLHAAGRGKGPLQKGENSGKPTILTQEKPPHKPG